MKRSRRLVFDREYNVACKTAPEWPELARREANKKCKEKGQSSRSAVILSSDSSSKSSSDANSNNNRNQKAIKLIDEDIGDSFYVEAHSTKRNKKLPKKKKFIPKGWYEYAKKNKIRRGDFLNFTFRFPPKRLHVELLNH
ncbi:hypothetical protein RYX36_009822 [Vicia faba]